jgi:hypothetical protein
MKSQAQRRWAMRGPWNVQRLVRIVRKLGHCEVRMRELGHCEVRFDSRIVFDGIEWRT